MATYPTAVESWVNRLDSIDTVWANDPNSLAAEIIAIENAVGTTPNVEGKVPVGNPVSYTNLSARVSDTLLRNQAPYVSLYHDGFYFNYGTAQPGDAVYNTYKKEYDPYGYYNGSDITIQSTGVYIIQAYQSWQYYTQGYLQLSLIINGVFTQGDLWHWNFPSAAGSYSGNYGGRWANTSVTWIGSLTKGTRVRVSSENGTNKNPYQVINGTFRAHFLRSTSGIGDAPLTNQPG